MDIFTLKLDISKNKIKSLLVKHNQLTSLKIKALCFNSTIRLYI